MERALQRLQDVKLGLLAESRYVAYAAVASGRVQLLDGVHLERVVQRLHTPGPQPRHLEELTDGGGQHAV